jgi:hypothetical protein
MLDTGGEETLQKITRQEPEMENRAGTVVYNKKF